MVLIFSKKKIMCVRNVQAMGTLFRAFAGKLGIVSLRSSVTSSLIKLHNRSSNWLVVGHSCTFFHPLWHGSDIAWVKLVIKKSRECEWY